MAPIRLATVLVGFVNSPGSYDNGLCRKNNYPLNAPFAKKPPSYYNVRSLASKSPLSNSRANPFHRQSVCLPAGLSNIIGVDIKPALYMTLLALQFACQPILTKKFTPKSINRSTVVMCQDVVKVIITYVALLTTGTWSKAIQGWSIRSWITVAGIPAFLYSIQNFATLVAYQNLLPLTFNVLNQTKTLSAALCCYIFMGKVQSKMQIVSLVLLFVSACIIEKLIPLRKSSSSSNPNLTGKNESNTQTGEDNKSHVEGVAAVITASLISGLAGALSQRSLQCQKSIANAATSATAAVIGGRNSYLFTMEIAIASLCFMTLTTFFSSDGKRIRVNGFFDHWTLRTIIPIITNAMGAILVGLVIKYAGAVKKGFALIFGLVLSGILQAYVASNSDGDGESKISFEQIVGGSLAAISMWMYNSFPAKVGF